jgi:hypothetical protein
MKHILQSVVILILWWFCAALDCAAQDVEISVAGGWIDVDQDDATSANAGWVGSSFKVRIRRPEIKVDYETFRRNYPNARQRFHLVSAGWLIQTDPRRVRPFFFLGWTLGVQTSEGRQNQGFQGLATAAGLTVSPSGKFFIRPELRWKLLGPGPMSLIEPGAAVGWQF